MKERSGSSAFKKYYAKKIKSCFPNKRINVSIKLTKSKLRPFNNQKRLDVYIYFTNPVVTLHMVKINKNMKDLLGSITYKSHKYFNLYIGYMFVYKKEALIEGVKFDYGSYNEFKSINYYVSPWSSVHH